MLIKVNCVKEFSCWDFCCIWTISFNLLFLYRADYFWMQVHYFIYCFVLIVLHLYLRWYLTLQGDNSLKSVECFDHMMFVCRFQASRWSKPHREKLLCGLWMYSSESVGWNLLIFWYLFCCNKSLRKQMTHQ